MSDGWDESAGAWIASLGHDGDSGDYGRQFVLDKPMTELAFNRGFSNALDVGCGEGRFCRMLRAAGIESVGVDPTEALIDCARERDPAGDYRVGVAERLDFDDGTFDLVVSYVSLVDIPDVGRAVDEMTRVLRAGGSLLIANLTSFNTAGSADGWVADGTGTPRFFIDNYLEERAAWASWRGIKVRNRHRPLSTYMKAFLSAGLILRHFSEPEPVGGDPEKAARFRRVPWFVVMEWQKPLP
jgi:SAM-dependent methyltransferase